MLIPKDFNEYRQTNGINQKASMQEFQEQQVVEDFWKIKQYFEDFCELLDSTGDERILSKCEKLSVEGIHVVRTARQ